MLLIADCSFKPLELQMLKSKQTKVFSKKANIVTIYDIIIAVTMYQFG